MSTAITRAFEIWQAHQILNNLPARPDAVIFAHVPGLNNNDEIDRDEGIPNAALIVYQTPVAQYGVINDSAVAYSVVLDTRVGDFSFNWIGLVDSASNTLCMIVHTALQEKIASAGGVQGNNITRTFMMEFDGAAESSQITVTAETWQIDFSARLRGIDEITRLANFDYYGPAAFFDNGFFVAKDADKYNVSAGLAYIGGIRALLAEDKQLNANEGDIIYADVSLQGSALGEYQSIIRIGAEPDNGNLIDYRDQHGFMHYVAILARITNGEIENTRTTPPLEQVNEAIKETLKTANNLSEIKAAGPEAIAEAIANLTLSEADDIAAGDALIAVKQPFLGAISRTVHDKMEEIASVLDAGAVGNAVTNDTVAFSVFEGSISGRDIDLHGRTHLVDAVPFGNRYFNGKFLISGVTHDANYILGRNVNNVVTTLGNSGANIPADYDLAEINMFTYRNGSFAAGGALNNATAAGQTIAIGPNAMGNTLKSFDNIAIGEVALQNVQSPTDSYSTTLGLGTRNVAIGGNAGQYLVDGRNNVFIGRNNSTGAVNVSDSISIGPNALSGQVMPGWYPNVENFLPNLNTDTTITAVGSAVGQYYSGKNITAFGHRAGFNLKTGDSNLLVGWLAGYDLEVDVGWGGKVRTDYDGDGPYSTYVKTGNNVVVTLVGHAAVIGGYAHIYWAVGGPAYANHGHAFPVAITEVTANTFTVQCPYSEEGTGNCRVYWSTSQVDAEKSRHNVFQGTHAAYRVPQSINSVVVGSLAAQNVTQSLTSAVMIGYAACQNATTTPNAVVAIGTAAFRDNMANIGAATAVGHNAGLVMQDGSKPNVSVVNSSMFGAHSAVSGQNQVQLGNSLTTTYVYGTVQNRSDIRDKYDVTDTSLGIDFILGLRAVEGRWDMRDDYRESIDVEVGRDDAGNPIYETQVRNLPKDGSKKRNRLHQWFIAQEVKALTDKLGVDFGGYQDHKLGGGCDVLSLGYDEFIPPIVKAVQQCWTLLNETIERLDKLEKAK